MLKSCTAAFIRGYILRDSSQRAYFWWLMDKGDSTRRLNYGLTPSSLVVDVGGFQGDFAEKIQSMYHCRVLVFEPITSFYEECVRRFKDNEMVKVFKFGLAGSTREENFSLQDDGTSGVKHESSQKEKVLLKAFIPFLKENHIENIDLMKINIEGGEYELLEHIIANDLQRQIKNFQIQFHDFFPEASERRLKIIKTLSLTHYCTYSYEFIWENWALKT